MIRAFIAAEIDQDNKRKISRLIDGLKKFNAAVKWVNENQIHLTLKFLGNVGESKIRSISDKLKSITEEFSVFNIGFSSIGAFPNMQKARVIWLGIEKGAKELRLLNDKIETELQDLGFERERREFKAHLTLGRVKAKRDITLLIKFISEIKFQLEQETKIDRLVLFKSTLTPKGAIYTPLSEHTLKE